MKSKPYERNQRLGHQLLDMLKKEVWLMFGMQVELTNVKLSKDFKYADIYFVGNEDLLPELTEASQAILNAIKPQWNAKYFPNLRFHIDNERKRLDKLDDLFEKIRTE